MKKHTSRVLVMIPCILSLTALFAQVRIPDQVGRRFRSKLATDSGGKLATCSGLKLATFAATPE